MSSAPDDRSGVRIFPPLIYLGGLLLGLYVGRPRTLRHVEDSGTMPDVIYIFQKPIEEVSQNEVGLIRQVRTTVLHEIGHHFGMTEEDLRRLGYA